MGDVHFRLMWCWLTRVDLADRPLNLNKFVVVHMTNKTKRLNKFGETGTLHA